MAVNNTHTTAAMPTTAAAMARTISSLLADAAAGAWAFAGLAEVGAAGFATEVPGAGAAGLAGVAVEVSTLAPAGGGAGGGGAPGRAGAGVAGAAGVGAATTAGAATGAPAAGKVGSLIVAVAEGFGGRLMRTVSFLG